VRKNTLILIEEQGGECFEPEANPEKARLPEKDDGKCHIFRLESKNSLRLKNVEFLSLAFLFSSNLTSDRAQVMSIHQSRL